MNEPAAMMNQQQQQQLMNMNQSLMSMNQMNPHPTQQPQPQVTKSYQNKPFVNRPVISQLSNPINFQPQMVQMNRGYGMWPQRQQFQNPSAMKPPASGFNKSLGPRGNWKGKRGNNKPNDKRRTELQNSLISGGVGGVNVISGGGGNLNFNNYNPPTLNELQHQNRLKTRKFFPKKKFNKNNNMNVATGGNHGRSAPFAPRNTTSFLIRAKKSGGIAPLVSPYPVTPAVLPTPIFSPSREVLVDMAKEEWGVDGYGSMKGLIRLRSPGHEMEAHEDDEEDGGGSSESDMEEHVEVERRLDHDLSRFEMICDPNNVNVGGMDYHNVLENRVDDQDTHIAHLEEENLILKERLFLMERELGDLRRRLLCLERRENHVADDNDEVVENESENECESRGEEADSVEDNNEDFNDENYQGDVCIKEKGNDCHITDGFKTIEKIVKSDVEGKLENEDEGTDIADKNNNVASLESKQESINDADEFIEAKRAEEEIAEMAEQINHEDKYVDEKVEKIANVDDESCKHHVEPDVCVLEGEVTKDSMVLGEEDAAS